MKIDIKNKSGVNKRIRLIPRGGASATLPTTEVNPTLAVGSNGQVTMCLTPNDTPEPILGKPDFAFKVSAPTVSTSASDTKGNSFGGMVAQFAMQGLESRFMALAKDENVIRSLSINKETASLDVELTTQVLPGDSLDITIRRQDTGTLFDQYMKQYGVTGEESNAGLCSIPLTYLMSSELITFQPNTRYVISVIAYRGVIGKNPTPIGLDIETDLEVRGVYTQDKMVWIEPENRIYMSLRFASDYVDSRLKGYQVRIPNINVVDGSYPILELPYDLAGAEKGQLIPGTTNLWAYQVSQTNTDITWEVYDSSKVNNATQQVKFPTDLYLYESYPKIYGTSDNNTLILCAVRGRQDSIALANSSVMVRNEQGAFVAVEQGGTVDLSTMPLPQLEGVYIDNSAFNDPGAHMGQYSSDMSMFMKILPPWGLTSMSASRPNEYVATLYDVVPNSSGDHTLTVSPSQSSLDDLLTHLKLKGRTVNYGADNTYTYKLLGTGNYLLVTDSGSNGFNSFLLKRTNNTWAVHTVFYGESNVGEIQWSPREQAFYGADAKPVKLEGFQDMSLLENYMFQVNANTLLCYTPLPTIPLGVIVKASVPYIRYNLDTKVINSFNIVS